MINRYISEKMGAGNIIENNIKSATTSLWNKVPTLAPKSWLDFDLNNYSKAFVNLAIVFGVVTVTTTTLGLTKSGLQFISKVSRKIPTSGQLHDKYGHHSWALIADCQGNQEYCKILAERGFNLVLMGDEKDVEIARDQVNAVNKDIDVETIFVNWKEVAKNLKYYEQLVERLKDFDISFLVLPKLVQPRHDKEPTHIERVQPFEHIYLLMRYIGEKLKWRSYMSAVIFPSYENFEEVTPDNGVSKCLIAGNDAFGRIMNFELRGNIQVVVARGSAENAFKGLGKQKITH